MIASGWGRDGCLQLLIAARVDLEAKDNVSEKMQVGLFVNASESVTSESVTIFFFFASFFSAMYAYWYASERMSVNEYGWVGLWTLISLAF